MSDFKITVDFAHLLELVAAAHSLSFLVEENSIYRDAAFKLQDKITKFYETIGYNA